MEPYLHRLRGDILLKRDPADPAPAEAAYRAAIAIAKQPSKASLRRRKCGKSRKRRSLLAAVAQWSARNGSARR
jgi:hypothetical protein